MASAPPLHEDFDLDSRPFDLDYDEADFGDTRQVCVIPWSGEVLDLDDDLGETRQVGLAPGAGVLLEGHADAPTGMDIVRRIDPDRTARVTVDPWTGQVLDARVLDRLAPSPPAEAPRPEPAGLGYATVLLIAAVATVGGAMLGALITLLARA